MGESKINDAIVVESSTDEACAPDGHAAENKSLVSRATQHLGLVVATTLFGIAVGGLLALAFALLRGRTAHRSDRHLALGLTAVVFVAAVAVPFLKYPANPPGVGSPDTIGYRTELYVLIVGGCLVALIAAWRVARLVPIDQRVRRLLAGGATFVALTAILVLRLPGIAEVPAASRGAC